MARPRTTYVKLQKEQARREKRERKAERRAQRAGERQKRLTKDSEADPDTADIEAPEQVPAGESEPD